MQNGPGATTADRDTKKKKGLEAREGRFSSRRAACNGILRILPVFFLFFVSALPLPAALPFGWNGLHPLAWSSKLLTVFRNVREVCRMSGFPVCLRVCLALPAALLLAVSGCGSRAPTAAPPSSSGGKAADERQSLPEINAAFARAKEFFAAGRTNEALACIDAALRNPAFAGYRPQILDAQLQALLRVGRSREAWRRALAASSDPLLATGACGVIYLHYRETGDASNTLAWAEELTANAALAPDMRPQAFTWIICDRIALCQDEQALAALGRALQSVKPSEGASLARQAIEAFLNAGRPERAEQALILAAGRKIDAVALRRLTIVTQTRLAAARGDWTALPRNFSAAVGVLPDDELDVLLHVVTTAASRADRRGAVDACAEAVLFGPAASSNQAVLATAARIWGENVMAVDRSAFPLRLDSLLHTPAPAAAVIALFSRHFYDFASQPAALRQLIELGERLVPLAGSENARNEIRSKILDGCFLVQDYDRALALAEARIPGPGRDEQWHVAAITKLKAHRALQRHEPCEAVKYFREFMDFLRAAKGSDVPDPSTGRSYPKEMILGRNAKRIGDILAGIPAAAEADKAYAEARDLYAQARKNATDAGLLAAIDAEAAQLPKTK